MKTLLSVIIPFRNQSETLGLAISSVLNQKIEQIEIWVLDDASDPNHATQAQILCEKHSKAHYWLSPKNVGVSAIRNQGIKKSQGEWLIFLDADDQLLPNSIPTWLGEVDDNTHWLIGKGHLTGISPTSFTANLFEKNQHRYWQLGPEHPGFFWEFCPPIHAMFFRRTLLNRHVFDEELHYGEDRELWHRLRSAGVVPKLFDDLVANYCLNKKDLSTEQITWLTYLQANQYATDPFQKAYLHLLLSAVQLRRGQLGNALVNLAYACLRPGYVIGPLGRWVQAYFKSIPAKFNSIEK